MYLPAHFEERDQSEIAGLVEQFPLAAVVCHSADGFIANHIPLLKIAADVYAGHIARANTLHTLFPDGTDAIAIFTAENSYVSPNWYPSKEKTHRQVPTWNYQVVHLHGRLEFDDSHKAKLATVGKLTKLYERLYSPANEWRMADAPQDYLGQMLDNIVALTLKVNRVSAKSKLSQNREAADFDSVASAMERAGKVSLSAAMGRIDASTDKRTVET